jgi:ribose transport system substrate-binding protein
MFRRFSARKHVSAIVVAAAMLGLSACGSSSSAGGSKHDITVGFVFNTSTDPNQQTMYDGIKKAAEAKGWTVKQADANNDASKANSLISAFASQKVDLIMSTVFDPAALRQGIAAANQRKIPFIATYSFGTPSGVAAVFTATAGKQETERMVKDLGGSGDVLAFTFKPGQPCVEAEKAFDSVLAANPGIKVTKQEVPAPGWEQAGLQSATAWLKSHPKGSGNLAIWGCWDGPSLGAIRALKQAGRDDVKVYGQYGEAGAIKSVEAGDMTATYWFDNAIAGQKVIDTASTILDEGASWKPTNIQLDPIEVDSGTVKQFLADHPQAVAGS